MITVDPMKETNITYLQVLEDEIDMNPIYQRESDIWPLSKKQLFVDSLINGIDIPKLYFHELRKSKNNKFQYAVVDGKQRLETIFSFLRGEFSISQDFVDFSGEFKGLAGKKYFDLAKISPKLKARFDAKQLPIHIIRTDDEDLIEEMFYRLNEAAPLNAAEKRNSFSGPFSRITKDVSKHEFFAQKVSFTSKRFKHYDSIAKLLLVISARKIVDTKKIHLDSFAISLSDFSKTEIARIKKEILITLDFWAKIFPQKDVLLKSPSNLPVYLVVFMVLQKLNLTKLFNLRKLREFEKQREINRELATTREDSSNVNYNWLEYDRLIQSPNDSSSIKFRAQELLSFLGSPSNSELSW